MSSFEANYESSNDDKTLRRHLRREKKSGSESGATPGKIRPTKLRIIGGLHRGRGVLYTGDRTTRPMKDSLRETTFNILGNSVKGSVALDLFAGTGILAIESLSRGASHAVAIERSGATAKVIRQSADQIGVGTNLEVLTGDTFRIAPTRMREMRATNEHLPWVVFFCPPYSMWLENAETLIELLQTTINLAPKGSQLVAESDKFFDVSHLPGDQWDIRRKGNVVLSFLET